MELDNVESLTAARRIDFGGIDESDCVQKSELLKLQPQLLDSVWFKLLEDGADESTKKVLDDISCAFAMDQPDTSEPVATGPTSESVIPLESEKSDPSHPVVVSRHTEILPVPR